MSVSGSSSNGVEERPWERWLVLGRDGDWEALRAQMEAAGVEPLTPALDGLEVWLAVEALDREGVCPRLGSLADPVGALLTLDALSHRSTREVMAREESDAPVWDGLSMASVSRLVHLGAQSRHCGKLAARHPDVLRVLTAPEGLSEARSAQGLLSAARAVTQACEDFEEALMALRRWRSAELVRAFYREATRLAPLEVTTGEISALAAACLEVVLERSRAVEAATGDAVDSEGRPIPATIIGLGKLGGWELNFSSDVDIVMVYGTDEGVVQGSRSRSADTWEVHRFFIRVARRLTQALEATTASGWLWRVDLRLRPGGARGPLVHSLSALEAYYEAWGRTFERAVWLKARPVAGDQALGRAVVSRLKPFVYRRHLDTSAFDELKEMKARIDRHATQSRSASVRRRTRGARAASVSLPPGALSLLGWDVKTGHGGIREVEFVIQALQLVYGGRRSEVREQGSLRALEALQAAGLLSAREVDTLATAYTLLRLLEHRVQMEGERQTHELPTRWEELARLGRRLGYEREAFVSVLLARQSQVAAIFARLFDVEGRADEAGRGAVPEVQRVLDWPQVSMDDEAQQAALAELGFERPRQALGHLMVLRGRPTTPFSPQASPGMARLGAAWLTEVLESADPDLALVHTTDFQIRVGPRGALYDVLSRSPMALRVLVGLFGASRHLSRFFVRQPDMIEALTTLPGWGALASLATQDPAGWDRARLEAELSRVLSRADGTEGRLAALRRFQRRCELRVALADMGGFVGPRRVTAMLSMLAEVCLEAVREEAWRGLIERYGEPRDETGRPTGFCALALGKLGSGELSYGSDLDLVFVYEGEGRTCGIEKIGNREFFAKLARRMIAYMSTQLIDGRLYEIDTRLRPSGRGGTLVVSMASFEQYHRHRAQLWERQSLLRARPLCQVGSLGGRLRALIASVLLGSEQPWSGAAHLCEQLAAMKLRMASELAASSPQVYNIKLGEGGIVDVEFAVQACQLLWGASEPRLRNGSVFELLEVLERQACFPAREVRAVADAYTFLRRLEGRLRMLEGQGHSEVSVGDKAAMTRLARRAGYRGQAPGEELTRDLDRARVTARAFFERVVVTRSCFEG